MKNKYINFLEGTLIAGCLCFFACGGFESILLTVLLFMIITNLLFIDEKDAIYVYNIFCNLIILLRINFLNILLIPSIFNYFVITFNCKKCCKIYVMCLLSNICFLNNFSYFNLFLFIINFFSYVKYFMNKYNKENIKKNIYYLNFSTLSFIFIHNKGYFCVETLMMFCFLLIQFLCKKKNFHIIIYILFAIIWEFIKRYASINIFNEKGYFIILLNYLFNLLL